MWSADIMIAADPAAAVETVDEAVGEEDEPHAFGGMTGAFVVDDAEEVVAAMVSKIHQMPV